MVNRPFHGRHNSKTVGNEIRSTFVFFKKKINSNIPFLRSIHFMSFMLCALNISKTTKYYSFGVFLWRLKQRGNKAKRRKKKVFKRIPKENPPASFHHWCRTVAVEIRITDAIVKHTLHNNNTWDMKRWNAMYNIFYCVVYTVGCGLNFHKRCAYKIPNNCTHARRRSSTASQQGAPYSSTTNLVENPVSLSPFYLP